MFENFKKFTIENKLVEILKKSLIMNNHFIIRTNQIVVVNISIAQIKEKNQHKN